VSVPEDVRLGLLAIMLAAAYWVGSTGIQQSLLSDAVGADGVPRALAYAMAGIGALLLVRGLLKGATEAKGDGSSNHLKSAGLLAMLVCFMGVTALVGYAIAIAALIAAVAIYAGARPLHTVAVTAVVGAATLWLMFRVILGVPMPAGAFGWG
jgi:hypothetical protein